MDEAAIRSHLHTWILERAQASPDIKLEDDTPILDSGLLSSLDVVELILYVESLKGEEVDVDDIEPEVLTNIDTLYAGFFAEAP